MPVYQEDYAERPGRVTSVDGIILQNDGKSGIGRMFIRPLETLDRWIVGILPKHGDPPLAIHAGIRVSIDGDREYVAEQLVGSSYLDFKNGLNWTPLDTFRQRDHGGWDETVAATAFRAIDAAALDETVERLNTIEGHPFLGEDCIAFIERAFGRRMFADSPLLRLLGIGARIGDPALPLLKPDAPLSPEARQRLQFEGVKELPDAVAGTESPNVRVWVMRVTPLALLGVLLVGAYWSRAHKPTPRWRTTSRFLRGLKSDA